MSIVEYLEARGELTDRSWWESWEHCREMGVVWGGWYSIGIDEYARRQVLVMDYLCWLRSHEVAACWVSDEDVIYRGEVRGGVF